VKRMDFQLEVKKCGNIDDESFFVVIQQKKRNRKVEIQRLG